MSDLLQNRLIRLAFFADILVLARVIVVVPEDCNLVSGSSAAELYSIEEP
jgi:hypothetical protein